MNAFLNHFMFELKTGIRNKTLLLMNYLFPLGFYAMMGLMMTKLNPLFLETMLPGMVIFAVIAAALLGIPDQLVTARDTGIFRSYKINGVPVVSILVIPALTTMLHLMLVALIMAITAPLFFNAPTPANWLVFALIFLLTAFSCTGLAALIGVVSSSSRMTILWTQLIFLPSMMLGGISGIPSHLLPGVMKQIALLLPATHAMNAFQSLTYGMEANFSSSGSLLILLTSGLLAYGLAIYLFNWDRHSALRRRHPMWAVLALVPYIFGIFLLV